MLKKLSLLSLLFIAIFFSQCSSDPIQADLMNYINTELPKLAPLESEAIESYSSVAGANYTSDSAMYYKIKEVTLPKYTEFSSKLQAVSPATEELKKIHAEYVKASQDQLEGFKLILDALEKQDANEIQKANADLNEAGALIEQWKTDLLETCKKHNITLDNDKK